MLKVCIVLPTSNYLHRQILEGVVDYGASHGRWQLFLVTDDIGLDGLRQARTWGVSGVIALGRETVWAREILRWKVPTVLFNCSVRRPPRGVVFLQRDQERIGRTAAEYFLERDYSSFAFIGAVVRADWSDRRRVGFVSRLAKEHRKVRIADFSNGTAAMRRFLLSLPGGTAVFVAHDRGAQRVLGLCLELGIAVPERLAVLGVDDDRIVCEAMTPSLSSISLDGVNSGRLAAELLDELMRGESVDRMLKLDFPRVITRQSTDTNMIGDTVIARTLARITADLSRPVRLNRVAAELGYSLRTIEAKARCVFGCTLSEKVNRIRLDAAVRLLSNSTLPVQEVAERCGFCSASHLGAKMRAAFGYSPSVFRH